jgi:hypothetical protein
MAALSRYVLALDPGKASGWAFLDVELHQFESGEFGFQPMYDMVEQMATLYGDQLSIVAEKFVITAATARNTSAPWSLEGIGAARYIAGKYGCAYETQAQASAKRFSSDDRLKVLGWHARGKGHANDASRHLLLYVVSRGWWRPELAPEAPAFVTNAAEA